MRSNFIASFNHMLLNSVWKNHRVKFSGLSYCRARDRNKMNAVALSSWSLLEKTWKQDSLQSLLCEWARAVNTCGDSAAVNIPLCFHQAYRKTIQLTSYFNKVVKGRQKLSNLHTKYWDHEKVKLKHKSGTSWFNHEGWQNYNILYNSRCLCNGSALKDLFAGGIEMNSDTPDESTGGFSFSFSYWLLWTS